jgi:hypothetical protein
VFKVGIIKIIFKFLFIKNNFCSFKKIISKLWQFFSCLHVPLNFHFFKKHSATRIAKLRKFKTKKACWLGGRESVSNYSIPKFRQIMLFLQKKQK